MDVHLVDGTYELFRYHFAPNNRDQDRGATIGVVGTLLQLVDDGATHLGVATDHVIESFRNDLWAGLQVVGRACPASCWRSSRSSSRPWRWPGFTVWPQVAFEADDGMAAGAVMAAADPRVERVDHLHARQGPRAVRRRQGRPARPAQGRRSSTPPGSRSGWASRPRRSPTCWRSWATRPTASRGCRAGAPSRRRRCCAGGATSRTSPPTRPRGTSGCAVRPSSTPRLREQFELALLFRRIATVETDAPVSETRRRAALDRPARRRPRSPSCARCSARRAWPSGRPGSAARV